MKEKYLPIGSVVMLKNGTKRVMVAGYLAVDKDNTDVIYDYSGCMFPEGFLGSDQVLLFNHDQIEKIYFEGFDDEEQKEFLNKLKEISEDLKASSFNHDILEKIDTQSIDSLEEL